MAWETLPIAQLLALPTDAKPVTEWANRDRAFREAVIEIMRVAEQIASALAEIEELEERFVFGDPEELAGFQSLRQRQRDQSLLQSTWFAVSRALRQLCSPDSGSVGIYQLFAMAH